MLLKLALMREDTSLTSELSVDEFSEYLLKAHGFQKRAMTVIVQIVRLCFTFFEPLVI